MQWQRNEARNRDRRTNEVTLWVRVERFVIVVTMLACALATAMMIARSF
jgi:hypothetical protein